MSATDHNSWSLDCKVYIGGLGEGADKDEISSACSHYGEIKNLWVARNPPGFAFVEFTDPRDAQDAVYALHGTRFNGRRIKVEMSTGKTKTVKSSSELMRYSSRSLTRSRSRSRSIYSDRSRSYRHDRRHSRSYTPDSQYSYRSRSRSRSYFRSRSRSISSMRRSRSRSIDQGEGHHRRSYRGKRSHRVERRSEAHASPRQVAENVTSDSPRGLCETEVTREKPKGDIHSESVGVQTDFYLLLHFVQKSPHYLKENFLRLDRDNVLHNSEHMEIIPSKYQRQRITNGTTQSSSTKHSHKKPKSSSGTSHKKPSKVSSQDQKQDIDIFDKEEQSKEKVSLNADLLDIPTPDDDGNHVLGNSSRAKVVVNFTPISVKKADLKKNGLSVDKSPKNDKNQDDTKSTKIKKKAKSSENNKDGITKDSKKRAANKDKHSKNVIYNNNNLEKPIQLYSSSEDHPETGAKRSPSKFERISLNRNNDSEDEEMGSTAERKLKDTQ